MNSDLTVRQFCLKQAEYLDQGIHKVYYQPTYQTILKLLSWYYQLKRFSLYKTLDQVMPQKDQIEIERLIHQLYQGEPFEYITGEAYFNELSLSVTKDVLIPRPETEELYIILQQDIQNFLKVNTKVDIADLCTGSGCLAIHIAYDFECSRVWATDWCQKCLDIAKKNAKRYKVEDQINFLKADVVSSDLPLLDFIVSNPPYLRTEEIAYLDFWVREKEPHLALNGGKNGLKIIKRVIKKGFFLLKRGGTMYIEIGWNQVESIRNMMEKDRINFEILKDMSQKERFVKILKP